MHDFEPFVLEAESLLGVAITIHDFGGAFHDGDSRPLFLPQRCSHQKLPTCHIGFGQRCIDHCRYSVIEQLQRERQAFIHTCWKGLQEIAIPIRLNDVIIGTVFAGIWRHPNGKNHPSESALPRAMIEAYETLEPLPQERVDALKNHLEIWSRGLVDKLQALHRERDGGETRTGQIRRFIREHANQPIGLANLARHVGLSPSRTSHLVSELLGDSFQSLLRQERIKRVCTLLLTTDLPLAVIAQRVGFPDEFYLSRVFKKEMSIPPGNYRNTYKTSPTKTN